jgi:hypothetical protein
MDENKDKPILYELILDAFGCSFSCAMADSDHRPQWVIITRSHPYFESALSNCVGEHMLI